MLLTGLPLLGAGISIVTEKRVMSSIGYDGSSMPPVKPENAITIDLKLSCSGRNLRTATVPLSAAGIISPTIDVTYNNGKRSRWVSFRVASGDSIPSNYVNSPSEFIPTWIAHPSGCNWYHGEGEDNYTDLECVPNVNIGTVKFHCIVPPGKPDDSYFCPENADSRVVAMAQRGSGAPFGSVRIKIPALDNTDDFDANWLLNGSIKHPVVNISFDQVMIPGVSRWGEYFGFAGTLTAVPLTNEWDATGTRASFTYSFFGEEGFCGGFHSPLILFFGDEKPYYTSMTKPLALTSGRTLYWPEKNSGAFFLALDKNKNGIIDAANELFGSLTESEGKNGFEELAIFDSNKDGFIDSKDKVFKDLLLWNDSTGEGRSFKEDLFKISDKGVVRISLKYKTELLPHGARAEDRQNSFFEFKSKTKNNKKGRIIDVWFKQPNT
jgi:hypothetical protein